MSRAWATGQAVLLVVAGLVVVSLAAVGSSAVAQQHPATQSGGDDPAPGERLNDTVTTGSPPTFEPGWNMGRANAANTNYINTTGPTNPITTRWTFATNANEFGAGPVVVNGTVYFGTRDYDGEGRRGSNTGKLYAVDAWTGEKRWTFQSPSGKYPDHIAVLRDTVYVGTYNGRVYALDAATGDQFWTFQPDGRPKGLTVANRTLYVASKGTAPGLTVPDGRVYALGALRGEERWQVNTDGPPTGLAVKDGTTYVTTWSGSRVYGLDAETGAEQWNVELNGWLDAPVVANGIVYVGNKVEGNDLYALNAETGNHRWKRTIQKADSIASPSVLGNTVYFTGKSLHAVKATTGADRWTLRSPRDTPVLLNDIGYLRGGDTIYTLDPETGTTHVRFSAANARFTEQHSNARFQGGMAVLNGSFYTGYGFDEPRTKYDSDHTSLYALGTPEFTYSDLSVTPRDAEINESVTATVTVRNTGTGPGTFNASLVVNGNVTNATTGRLNPRTSQTITVSHRFPQNGTYTVKIAGLTRTITIGDVALAPTPTPTPTAESDPDDSTPTGPSGEMTTAIRSDSAPTATATPTPTSEEAPGFGVGIWVAAVALMVILVKDRLHKGD